MRVTAVFVGTLTVLLVVAVTVIPWFLNTESARREAEARLTHALGRNVSIDKLSVSLWQGSLAAQGISVADEPAQGARPFLTARELRLRLSLPLLLRRIVKVEGLVLESPQVQLVRDGQGRWNYASFVVGSGSVQTPGHTAEGRAILAIRQCLVRDGQVTVMTGAGASATSRVYRGLAVKIDDLDGQGASPLSATMQLPGGGRVQVQGAVQPGSRGGQAIPPFSIAVQVQHFKPELDGFNEGSWRVGGDVAALHFRAVSVRNQLRFSELVAQGAQLSVATLPAHALRATSPVPSSRTAFSSVTLDKATLQDSSLRFNGRDGHATEFAHVQAVIANLARGAVADFSAAGDTAHGGHVNIRGHFAQPPAASGQLSPDAVPSPMSDGTLDAQVAVQQLDLAATGAGAGANLAGTANAEVHVQTAGSMLRCSGTARIAALRLARNGTPSAVPVTLSFAISQDAESRATPPADSRDGSKRMGRIDRADVSIGAATAHIDGTYAVAGHDTELDLRVNGQSMPIDPMEAFLPSLGIELPHGSQLRGGTLSTELTITGAPASPHVRGSIGLRNTELAGFDLGAQLQVLARFTGGKLGTATRQGTAIQSLTAVIDAANGSLRTDNLALNIAGVGTATGQGTVHAGGALDYDLLLKLETSGAPANNPLAGGLAALFGGGKSGSLSGLLGAVLRNGVPVRVGGTSSHPSFAVDLHSILSKEEWPGRPELLHPAIAKSATIAHL
ncbi:AsmA family protein [Acidipila sp. EB88]|nr:AsmA family protein [Acidipila sp. EB88]